MFFEKYSAKKDGVIRAYDVHSSKVKVFCIVLLLISFIVTIVCFFPAIWVFLASFKDIREFTRNVTILPSKFSLEPLKETWNTFKFGRYYVNSFISVMGCVICAVIFNGLLAYGLAVLRPKGYKIAYGLIMWSLLIPSVTSIVGLIRNISIMGMTGSFIPIWLSFGANAFYVVLFKQFFESLPKDLLEAARLDGCGVLQIFTRIVLPMSKPIIAVVAIFAFTAAWSDFLLPYLVLNGSGKETVMVRLFAFKDTPTNAVQVLRAVLFSIIPPTIIFTIFQRQITDNAAVGAVKG